MKNFLQLTLWIISFQAMGYIIGLVSRNDLSSWYVRIQKSTLTPPNYIFPIAWTTLYVILAICGWLIFQKYSASPKILKYLFIIGMLLNWLWTPIFFNLHWVWTAFIIIDLMILTTLGIIIISYTALPLVSYLLVPYFLWLVFASYLNMIICVNY